jgi:hypothetical protein
MSEVNSSIKFASPERGAWLSSTLLSRSLFAGSEAMLSQGTLFLPQGASESDAEYKQRKDDSFLIPAYKKVVQLLAGQAFKTDVIVEADGVFEEIAKQPSINDDSITNFCKKSFERDLVDGCNHILVDAPVDGGRPFFRSISPESISAVVYDQGKLVCLKIDEKFEEKEGRFSSKQLNQWRVFELEYIESIAEDGTITYSYGQCNWEVWRESGSTEKLFDSGYLDIDYIPIALFSGVVYGEPLLSDLADLCKAHWQSNSKQTYIMSAARTPILFTKNLEFEKEIDADGNEKPTFRASSRRFLIGGDDSDAKWVEIQGGSIDAGFKHLDKIENAMESYGVNLFYRPEQTATAKGIDSAAAYSTLESWALIKQSQIQTAFEIAGDLLGVPFPEDAVSVQREYLGWAQSAEVRAMLAMLLSGNAISPETAFNTAKRYVQPIENEDWKDESKRIGKQQLSKTSEEVDEQSN